jgi:hypothetical protein
LSAPGPCVTLTSATFRPTRTAGDWIGGWAHVWLSPATPCCRADDDAAKPDGLALSPLKASKPLNEIGITVICCQCWPSTRVVVAQDGSDLRGDRTAAERIGDQIRQVVVA